MDRMACCYFPTVTVLVDDQRSFLSKIELNLQEVTALRTFEDPLKALAFINDKYTSTLKLDKIIINSMALDGSSTKPDQHALTIDVPAILKHLYDPKRFLEISDILVDYNMPSMNGINLCEKITSNWMRKLMITGDADTNIAISAFNKGIISKFIPKQTEHFTQTLIECIQAEKACYFTERSTTIMNTLLHDTYNCLQNPNFTTLFTATCTKHEIVEYYMIDDSGSYLMLDKAGKPTWFIVRSEQALEDDFVFAEDGKAPKGVLDVLKNREKLAFLFSEKDQHLPPIKWLPYLHPANAIPRVDGFYYAVISGEPLYDHQLGDITSYEQFIKENQLAA